MYTNRIHSRVMYDVTGGGVISSARESPVTKKEKRLNGDDGTEAPRDAPMLRSAFHGSRVHAPAPPGPGAAAGLRRRGAVPGCELRDIISHNEHSHTLHHAVTGPDVMRMTHSSCTHQFTDVTPL